MDKASIFGVVTGTGLVLTAILLGGSLMTFVNAQGLLIVLGGTFAAVCIAFPTRELKLILPVTRRVFKDPGDELLAVTQHLVKAAQIFKRDGPLALEGLAKESPSEPLAKGMQLIADGTDTGTIHEILNTEQKYMEEHHRVGQKIFNEMGKYAPAFGMVGTLIGLVQMLSDMSDPDSLGPNMAVALLTTFYGAVFANLIFIPMVSKLDRRVTVEITQIQLAIVGLVSIQRGDSTQILREKVSAFLQQNEGDLEAALKV